MDLNLLRKRFHHEIKPLTKILARYGIKPNAITSTSLLLMLPASYFLIIREENIFIIIFSLVAFLDALDGAVAENEGIKTKFGAFYDAFSDRIVEGILYLSISISYPGLYIPAFVALILSYLVSYTAAWRKDLKNIGIGKRAFRLAVFIIFFIAGYLFYALILISILSAITIMQRMHKMILNRKEL